MSRPGPLAIRLSDGERRILQAAADRAGVPLSTWMKATALEVASNAALVIPGPVAQLIREEARARGIEESTLAALLAQRALLLHDQ